MRKLIDKYLPLFNGSRKSIQKEFDRMKAELLPQERQLRRDIKGLRRVFFVLYLLILLGGGLIFWGGLLWKPWLMLLGILFWAFVWKSLPRVRGRKP